MGVDVRKDGAREVHGEMGLAAGVTEARPPATEARVIERPGAIGADRIVVRIAASRASDENIGSRRSLFRNWTSAWCPMKRESNHLPAKSK